MINTFPRRIVSLLLATLLLCGMLALSAVSLPVQAASVPQGWADVSSSEWMKYVPDETPLHQINIPGAHDAGTQYVTHTFYEEAQCQDTSIQQQLNMGVRYLDVRLKYENAKNYLFRDDIPAHLRFTHGGIDCLVDDSFSSDWLRFDDVLQDWIYPFLRANPSETIVMCIQEQNSNKSETTEFSKLLHKDYIDKASSYWYLGDEIPSLNEVRGKIVLMRRYNNPKNTEEGLDFTGWPDGEFAEETFSAGGSKATVQDQFRKKGMEASDKWTDYVEPLLKKARNGEISDNYYIINYTSANNLGKLPLIYPDAYASAVNNYLRLSFWRDETRYGWIPMDFVTKDLCKLIYGTNVFLVEREIRLNSTRSTVDGYEITFSFTEASGNVGRCVRMEYSNLYNPSDRNADSLTVSTDGQTFTFFLPYAQLYAHGKYNVSIYEVDGRGRQVSNILPVVLYTGTESSTQPPVYPEWVKRETPQPPVAVSVSPSTSKYRYDNVTYSIQDSAGNTLDASDAPILSVELTEGDQYYTSRRYAYDWRSGVDSIDGVLAPYQPNFLGQPTITTTGTTKIDSVQLNWDYPAGNSTPEQFEVTLNGGGEIFTRHVGGGTTSVDFFGLVPNTTYTAQVTAVAGGLEFASVTKDITTLSTDVTVTPRAGDGSSGNVVLTAAASNATSYEWQQYNKSSGNWGTLVTHPSSASTDEYTFSFAGSSNGIERVRCVVNSMRISNQALIYGPPDAPASFAASTPTLSSIDLGWTWDPANGPLSSFELTYSPTADPTSSTTLILPGDTTASTVSGLLSGTDYTFSLVAVSLLGAESAEATATETTLFEAGLPENTDILRNPSDVSSYITPITFTAAADLPATGGNISYQWQMTNADGLYEDISGAAAATYQLTPSPSILGRQVRCAVTNTLNGTTATATTPELFVLFQPPAVETVNAEPDTRLGAKRINVRWQNPSLSSWYIVVCVPAGGGTLLSEGSRVQILEAQGGPGDWMETQFTALDPATTYEIRIENVLKNPLEDGWLPANLNDIVKLQVTTLAGVEAPLITNSTGDQLVPEGGAVTFSALVTPPTPSATGYLWQAISPELLEAENLSYGQLHDAQTVSTEVDATMQHLDGYYILLRAVSENNGDMKLATSIPSLYRIEYEGEAKIPGDKANVVLPISMLLAGIVSVLLLSHRRQRAGKPGES